jgi:hypothetical protein
MTLLYALNHAAPETDNKLNPEMINTLGAVDILDLTGKDCTGSEVKAFRINSLPLAEQGVLYYEDGATPVTVNSVICITDAKVLKFDPEEGYVGNATFNYSSVDVDDDEDSSPATFTIPVISETGKVDNNGTVDSNGTVGSEHTVHNGDCGCSDYDESIPSLTFWSILLLLTGTSLLSFSLVRKELV